MWEFQVQDPALLVPRSQVKMFKLIGMMNIRLSGFDQKIYL